MKIIDKYKSLVLTYSWKFTISASTIDIEEGDPLTAETFYAVYDEWG